MKQTIHIRHLTCDTIIGIYAHELGTPQPLVLHLELTTDASKVIASGHIADTVDYDALSRHLKDYLASRRFALLESLLDELLKEIAKDEKILAAKLTIDKPRALEAHGAIVSISGEWNRGA